jgi:hypothetical protein
MDTITRTEQARLRGLADDARMGNVALTLRGLLELDWHVEFRQTHPKYRDDLPPVYVAVRKGWELGTPYGYAHRATVDDALALAIDKALEDWC